MKCKNCGMENAEDTMFCGRCGERLKGKPSGLEGFNEDAKKEHLGDTENAKQASTQNTVKSESKTSANKTINSNVPKSPLARAWKDMRTSKNWFGKTVVLGLINCVPIWNFNVLGYAMNWGKHAGKDDGQMQRGYFEDHGFRNGFYGLVVWVVYGIVLAVAMSILNSILDNILIIGALMSLALVILSIIFYSYTALSCMRGCKNGDISRSFYLKEIFMAYKKEPGKVFTSWFVPQIIIVGIILGVVLVVGGVTIGAYIPFISKIVEGFSHQSTQSTIMSIISILGPSIAILVIIGIISQILQAFATVLNYRALGYWIADNAPEWNKD